jgi:hypothetical protein
MNRIANFLRTIRNPNLYHGHGVKPPFFEGWYFKMVSADQSQRLAVIPGIFLGQGGQAFIQVLDGLRATADFHEFPVDAFWASETDFEVRVGANHFTRDAIRLDIDDELGVVKGELQFSDPTPWPVSWTSPGIMGWYAWVPRMECYHGVVSLDHRIQGSLEVNGELIDFSQGRGYIEKDWGQAFPSGYVWMQSNHFETLGASFTGSIAMIPWLGRSFRGFIVGFWHAGRLYRFATYTGARTTRLEIDDSQVRWRIEDRHHTLEIIACRESGAPLKGPSRQDMLRRVEETMLATIELRLETQSGQTLFHETGGSAALEVHGELDALLGAG